MLGLVLLCSRSNANARLQLIWHNGTSSRIYNNDPCRHISISPHAHNAVDDPARSITRIRLTRTATLPPTMHRHRLDILSPTRAPVKSGSRQPSQAGTGARTTAWNHEYACVCVCAIDGVSPARSFFSQGHAQGISRCWHQSRKSRNVWQ